MNRKLLAGLAFAFSVAGSGAVLAHSAGAPKHGGVVVATSDLSFELVSKGDGAAIYVEDHGKPVTVEGMSGRLTILNGTEKAEADLKPAGDRLEAGNVKLVKGSKAVAVLNTATKKNITVRFTVK